MRRKAKLYEFVHIEKGNKVSEYTSSPGDGLSRYIQIDDLRNNNNIKFTSEKGVRVNEQDLIIAWDGANAGLVGYKLEGVIGSTLAKISINSDEVIPAYLGRFLQSKNELIKSQRTGTTIPHVHRQTLLNLEMTLPPLPEQQRIVKTLDTIQGLIDKRKETIRLLDEYIKAVFLDMFGDPVTNPKGWEVKRLGEMCKIKRGASPRPINDFIGNDIPWIKISDATSTDDIYINETKVRITKLGALKSVLVSPGDLIFANCGVSLGFAKIMNIKGCIHDGWLVFNEIANEVHTVFLLEQLNILTDYFRRLAPEGTQPNLNTHIMNEHRIILPPWDMQLAFVKHMHQILDLKKKIEKSLNLYQKSMQVNFMNLN